ncbi:zinc finger MYND domain-containing protein [Phanerochaete sordida]|uniref:Zinc finger MYND domain-containing protein n=1 Tax=Phanerochaete sordida TaxID=48140 RepID=A0A9P3LDR2_9APHY|nr:zinc finger MYND domain-containing protein [Phanerochaete sordida]
MSTPLAFEIADCNCGRSHAMSSVYLPLKDLSSGCAVCGVNEEGRQRLCSSCGERIYCSEDCQIKDWPKHKLNCGQTHRINLESFYPVLAVLADFTRCLTLPPHFAVTSQVVSEPNPSLVPSQLPSGLQAKLLEVDDTRTSLFTDLFQWAPLAQSEPVARKMMQRIMRQGNALPLLTALCVALLGEMYTTTSGRNTGGVRTRLQYRTSPIADFGIAAGSVKVHPSDRLAFRKRSTGTYVRGQDPAHHFWLYFTTVRGEEVLLDLSVFTFNLCMVVQSAPYAPPRLAAHAIDVAPAYFVDRAIRKGAANIYTERRRVSALRDARLHRAVRYIQHGLDDAEAELIGAFMRDVAGRSVTEREIEVAGTTTMQYCGLLGDVLQSEAWRRYPERPPLAIQADPGESVDPDDAPKRKNKNKKKKKKASQSQGQGSSPTVEDLMAELGLGQ